MILSYFYQDISTKALLIIAISLIYYLLASKNEHYNSEKTNSFELLSTKSYIVSLYLGFLISKTEYEFLSIICFIILLVINLAYIILIIVLLIRR